MMLAVVMTAVLAQPQFGGGPALRRVDEGVSDRDPLSVSMRSQQVDMRQPIGFSGVYQVEGRDMFVRRSGAIWAVFPRGLYGSDDGKAVVLAPAGMTFSIGTPQALREEADAVDPVRAGEFDLSNGGAMASPTGAPRRLDRRIDHALRARSENASSDEPAAQASPASPQADRRPPSGTGRAIDERASEPVPRFIADEVYRRNRLSRLLATSDHASPSTATPAP